MLKVQEIRELIKLIDQSSIDEFTYETNGTTVTMKKGSEQVVQQKVVHSEEKQAVVQEVPVAAVETKNEVIVEESKQEEVVSQKDYDHEITSPMVGTFYRAPNPESDPYVTVGSKVNHESIVCIVEAMKLFNEIEAETNGEIVEILVEDGELVEFGQPLFRVKNV